MTTIEQQILETWNMNHRTNLIVLDHLSEEALSLTTSKRGGGTVGHQLAHMYNVRFWKLEKINKQLVKDFTSIKAEEPKSLTMLRECH